VPGKATQAGARDADASGAFESVLADGHRHRDALSHALARGDQSAIKESASSLDTALKLIKETMTAGGAEHAAPRMHAAIDLVSHAEPLLARSRGGSAKNATDIAAQGTSGAGHELPHLSTIQKSFGKHDVGGVRAHVGGPAAAAAGELGASAYTHDNAVGFTGAPSLHLAAHEAAHVVQQRAGVQFKGGIDGGAGDSNERHADAVADAVVSGKSAEKLLDASPGGGAAVQRFSGPDPGTAPAPAQADDSKDPQDRGGRPAKGAGGAPKGDQASGAGGGGAKVAGGGGAPAGGGGGGGGGGGFAAAGIDAKPLKTQLAAFNQGITANSNTVTTPPGADGKPKKDSTEDHAKKVSQYDDGIDGIAGMIGDLDAFDELCKSLGGMRIMGSGDRDPAKQAEALGQIRVSSAFKQLVKMWQGALDGGTDSPAMQAAFDREFDSRGFFGSTQDAYSLVRTEAKAQAKRDADEEAKKKKAEEAANKQTAAQAAAKAGKTEAGKPNAAGSDPGAAGAAGASGVNAVVAPTAVPIADFDKLKGVTDGQFSELLASADHHAGLFQGSKQEGAESRRTEQIVGQLGLGGGAFVKGAAMTALWGTLAHAGERVAGPAIEKMLGQKAPIIGPIIMLATDSPFSANYWHEVGDGFGHGGKDLWRAATDWSAFKSCHSKGDYVGVICAKFADLFQGLYEVINTLNTLLGTLSALCLILGAVLIGVGIALCWLGIGEVLMAAGGWLVEAGEALGDLSLALMPVCLALSAIALVFRTAAAFLVPADVYADQLAEEGDASKAFGGQAGSRVGLDASRTIEEATPAPKPKAAGGGGAPASGGGEAAGQADAAAVTGEVKKGNDTLQASAHAPGAEHAPAAEHPATPEAAATPEAKPDAKPDATPEHEHADEKKADPDHTAKAKAAGHGDADAPAPAGMHDGETTTAGGAHDPAEHEHAGDEENENENENEDETKGDDKKSGGKLEAAKNLVKSFTTRLRESLKMSADVGRNLERVKGALKNVGELRNGTAASNRGLAKTLGESRPHLEKDLENIKEAAKTQQETIDKLLEQLDSDGDKLNPEQRADLQKQVVEAINTWGRTTTAAETIQGLLDNVEAGEHAPGAPNEEQLEGDSAEDENGSAHSNEEKLRGTEDSLAKHKADLEQARKERPELEHEAEKADRDLEAAKAHKEAADAKLKELAADPRKAGADAMAEHSTNVDRAHAMQKKAGEIRSAESARKTAEGELKDVVGQEVEVGGQPQKIVEIGADGVVVEPAGGGAQQTVPADQITGAKLPGDFKEQVDRLTTAKQQIAELTAGETGGNAGNVAKVLDDNANQILKSEKPRGPKAEAKRASQKKDAAAWNEANDQAQAEDTKSGDDVAAKQKLADAWHKEVDDGVKEETKLEHEIAEEQNEARGTKRAKGRHRRTELAKEHLPEFLAMLLGVNEKLEKLFEKIGHGAVKDQEERAKAEDPLAGAGEGGAEAKPEGGEGTPEAKDGGDGKQASAEKPAGGEKPGEEKPGEEKKEGEGEGEGKEGDEKAVEKIGQSEAAFELLLAMSPPPEISLLGDHRKKAADAAQRYYERHDWAYKCYQAELAVTKLAAGAGQMAEDGKPLHARAQTMQAPLEKSKSDEQARAQKLAGSQPGEVKGADSRLGDLVTTLITKMADHSDRLSQKPDAGGASGAQMAGVQDKASTEAGQRTGQSKDYSKQQQEFLDQALQARGQQEASVAKDIQSLKGKQQQELAIRDQIRARKAQALAEEAQAGKECADESKAFNEGYASASAWRTAYEAKRASLKSEEKG
jgi:hypothetical protein